MQRGWVRGWSRVLRRERGNTLWPPCSWQSYWRCGDNKDGRAECTNWAAASTWICWLCCSTFGIMVWTFRIVACIICFIANVSKEADQMNSVPTIKRAWANLCSCLHCFFPPSWHTSSTEGRYVINKQSELCFSWQQQQQTCPNCNSFFSLAGCCLGFDTVVSCHCLPGTDSVPPAADKPLAPLKSSKQNFALMHAQVWFAYTA